MPDGPLSRRLPARAARRAGTVMVSGAPPFERVVEDHGRAVLRFCAARVGRDRAEDCFQETMLAALRAYDSLRDTEAIRPWLLSIAARKAVDLHRDDARRPAPAADAGAGVPAVAPAETADDALWDAVRALPSKQREAVVLRFVADLTHAEIARVMETSEAAARRNLFEGLRRLRDGW